MEEGAVEPEGLKSSHIISQALNNNVILRRIFSFLKFPTLKVCRQVNKKWMDESQVFFKEQSAIKIRYDRKEPQHLRENRHTVEEFLTTFRNSPMRNTFSGIIFQFFVCGHSFQWDNAPLINFLGIYGSQITYLKLSIYELLDGETKKFDLFLFKKALSEYIPHLTHLNIIFCGRHLPENTPIIGAMKDALGPGMLPMLRKLEWDWEIIPPDPYSSHVSTIILADLLKSSPNLNSVIVKGSLFNAEAYDDLTEEAVSRIKEISFFPYSGCDRSAFCNKLIELAGKKLRISSLNVTLQDSEEEWMSNEQEFISWLIKFLKTQKDCLNELRLCLPFCDTPISTNYSFPSFPKMNKLNHLELRTSIGFPQILLRDAYENWGSLFPRLESLIIACTYVVGHDNHLYFSPKVVSVPNFLLKFGSQHSGNIKSVFLHSCNHRKVFEEYDLYGQQCNENTASKCYDQVKKLFSNMTAFQIYEVRNWHVYAFNGSKENFVIFRA